MVRSVRCLFAAIALVLLGVGPLHAQSASTASIGGTVATPVAECCRA